jgi:hypothetical protein
MLIQTRIQFLTVVSIQFYNFLLSVFKHGVILDITSEYSRPFVGRDVYHPYNERYILMWSAALDTLARSVLLEEDMYFNRGTFCS